MWEYGNLMEWLKEQIPEILVPPGGEIPKGYVEIAQQYDKDIEGYFTVAIPLDIAKKRGIDVYLNY